jgi:Nitroreductase family
MPRLSIFKLPIIAAAVSRFCRADQRGTGQAAPNNGDAYGLDKFDIYLYSSISYHMEMAMAFSRRMVLQAAGGAGLALIGTGGVFAVTRTPEKALQPWRAVDAAATGDIRLDAVRYAILAPNPHNRQPWQIRLSGNDIATLTCDLDRRLAETDPGDRQTTIGFGCFIEIARIAAAERGVRMELTEFPDGEPTERLDRRPIAVLRFVSDPTTVKDILFPFIPQRRSNRAPFDLSRPVAPEVLAELAGQPTFGAQIVTSAEPDVVASLRQLTWSAFAIEAATQRTWRESVNLTRIGKSEIEAQPDGIAVGGPFLDALALTGLLSREQMARTDSIAYKSGLDLIKSAMAATPAYGWVITDGNTRRDQLAAGRAYVRMNLAATRAGLGFHPNSQALQEFPEMADKLRDVHELLGVRSVRRLQMLVRLGYGAPAPASPRWPLPTHLVNS